MTKRRKKSKPLNQIRITFLKAVPIPLRHRFHLSTLFRRTSKPTQTLTEVNPIYDVLDQKLDFNLQPDRDYVNSLVASYKEDLSQSDTEGNETDRALSNQLVLVTTVLITANIIVFGNKELLASLTIVQGVFIMMGLLLLMISLLFGISYYQDVRLFHRIWADKRHDAVLAISGIKSGTSHAKVRQIIADVFKSLDVHVSEKNLKRQIVILKIALGAYFILALSLVGDFRFITEYWRWYT